jgi:hypothetical protein
VDASKRSLASLWVRVRRVATSFLATRNGRLWVVLAGAIAVGLAVGISLLVGGSASGSDSTYVQQPKDVTITSCGVHDGRLAGTVRVVNTSNDESTFAIKVNFEDPTRNTLYGVGNAIVDDVEPGKVSSGNQLIVTGQADPSRVVCQLAGAARYGT